MSAQESRTRLIFPIWTYHTSNTNICGLSLGLFTPRSGERHVESNGLRIEILGTGILNILGSSGWVANDEEDYKRIISHQLDETIRGVNLSVLGTMGDCSLQGIALDGFGCYYRSISGLSMSIGASIIQRVNGIQIAGYNHVYKLRGVQIGVLNSVKDSKGAQIGQINFAKTLQGIQIAIIRNECENLKGIQIGIWNVNDKRKMPLINWCF